MSPDTKFWIRIAGVAFFAGVALAEATGLKAPTFAIPAGWTIFAAAGAVMAFLAWRTRRRQDTDNTKQATAGRTAPEKNGTKE